MQMLLPRSGAVKDGARRADWTNMAGVECWIVRPDPLPEVRVTPQKRATKRRTGGRRATAPRARRAAEALPLEPILAPVEEALAGPLEETPLPSDLATIDVEPVFAGRVPPPEPERPLPSARRAIFFDVENTSRAEHIARMVDHLAVDRRGLRTDFVAVGNWRVIGHDTARLLARHGAHLVHSAPSVGVRDWSDLRIAVSAGVWLASARPGDVIEIVSDDRAFDAVGDVAAGLGITFRRLSYRGLTGAAPREEEAVKREPAPARGRGRGGRRGRRGGWRDRPAAPPAPAAAPSVPSARGHDERPPAGEQHTAPHDEIVGILRDLIGAAGGRVVTIDTLANALKSRGFSRPPGSPRLITRLRRIKELTVSRAGALTLADGDEQPPDRVERPADPAEDLSVGPGNEAPRGVGEAAPTRAGPAEAGQSRRRRSRRGGRRHRGRGAGAPSPAP
jgi:hypothetical protein